MSALAVGSIVDSRRVDRGTHEILWDGTDDAGHSLGSGVYLNQLRRKSETRRVKAVLLR